jgi:hypothetical protein
MAAAMTAALGLAAGAPPRSQAKGGDAHGRDWQRHPDDEAAHIAGLSVAVVAPGLDGALTTQFFNCGVAVGT